MRRRLHAGASGLLLFALLLLPARSLAQVVALVGGRIIDGRGGAPLADGVVLIERGKIRAAGPRASVTVPRGARRIDATGMSILPGIIESNGHVVFDGQIDHAAFFASHSRDYARLAVKNLGVDLQQGVTTIRDTHGPAYTLHRVARQRTRGPGEAARLLIAGAILNYESLLDIPTDRVLDPADVARARVELDRFVTTTADGVAQVRKARRDGADFIKISLSGSAVGSEQPVALSDTTLRAMVQEAHRLGLRTTAHAMNPRDVRRALDAGIDALEHPAFMIVAGRAVDLPDDVVQEIVRRRVYCVPLLVAMEVYDTFAEHPERLDDSSVVRGLRPELVAEARAWARQAHDGEGSVAAMAARYAVVRANQAKLIRAGALIAMGTDRGTRLNWHEHANHVRELEIYTELGMTPLEALTSATWRGAQLLGLERSLGTIEVGKGADLLVVAGDPSVRVRDVANVQMVFLGGRRVR